MVKHLNANMVGGKTASQLGGATQFHLGTFGATVSGTQLFAAKLPAKGSYDVNISGILTDGGSDTGDNVTCLVADKDAVLTAIGTSTPVALNKVYGVAATSQGDTEFGFLSSSNAGQKIANVNIVIGCGFNTATSYTVGRPVTFTFRPVSVSAKSHGSAIPLPRNAGQHLVAGTR
jgi:hypothetical protein